MWPLPARNLLFLGKVSEQKLLNQGIRTIGDLAKEREANVQLWLGEKPGHQLWQYARGIDHSTVKAVPDEAKGFSVETTFNDDITSQNRCCPFCWNSVMFWPPECAEKERSATVFLLLSGH